MINTTHTYVYLYKQEILIHNNLLYYICIYIYICASLLHLNVIEILQTHHPFKVLKTHLLTKFFLITLPSVL